MYTNCNEKMRGGGEERFLSDEDRIRSDSSIAGSHFTDRSFLSLAAGQCVVIGVPLTN